ncbi:phage terminase large subunit [Synechococcus sp. A10-1-5-9]|uniref:phage terminase large subunit n=1 Tax=Synechococcus sp. A10-1-5-9 TaxID=3392295 RepID=UPI0039ED7D30
MTASAPQQITPTPMQATMQKVPLDHDLIACGGRGSGKSFGGELVVARDSTVLREKFNCLIVRRSYAGLQELSNSLSRTLSATYGQVLSFNKSDWTLRLPTGGVIELAYLDPSRPQAMLRQQGRSRTTIWVDEGGQYSDPDMLDQLRATLRAPGGTPTRFIFTANPGQQGHAWIRQRWVQPAGFPAPDQPVRFYCEDTASSTVYIGSNIAANPHLDFEQTRRQIQIAAGGDPELLRAWLEGSFEGDVTGSYFGDAMSRRRNLLELNGDDRPEIPTGSRLLCSFDWGIAAPSCATLFITNHPLLPRGSLFAIDECYLAKSTRAGEPDWNAGLGASNLQQCQILKEWISRWGLEPQDLKWIADDACWNRTGHAMTIGDEFRKGGIPFIRAGKSSMTEEAGLARLRTMLWATDRDESQPWIKASRRCRAFWELTPLLARDTKKRELLDPTAITHSIDTFRYAVNYCQKPYQVGRGPRVW